MMNQTSLKKQKVEGHKSSCRGSTVSCVDCSVVFHGKDYNSHTSCISEAEAYQGALYQAKVRGGEGEGGGRREALSCGFSMLQRCRGQHTNSPHMLEF